MLARDITIKEKNIFFRLLSRFPSEKYSHLVHLTEVAYNSRPHTGIFNYTPHRAQHFDYTAGKIMRKGLEKYRDHQKEAFSVFQNLKQTFRIAIHKKFSYKAFYNYKTSAPLFLADNKSTHFL